MLYDHLSQLSGPTCPGSVLAGARGGKVSAGQFTAVATVMLARHAVMPVVLPQLLWFLNVVLMLSCKIFKETRLSVQTKRAPAGYAAAIQSSCAYNVSQ